MLTQQKLSVRSAVPTDRSKLANLIHFEIYVHRHLDWRPPLDWIGDHPYLLAEKDNALQAALACPPDPPGVAWVRLFAAAASVSFELAWNSLWFEALERLRQMEQVKWVAAIPLQSWFTELLVGSGFEQTHQVVMLSWEGHPVPESKKEMAVIIRPMNFDDIEMAYEIDEASFVPVWRNSQVCLGLAFRQAAVATVAENQGRIIGYQISTATSLGGHLARLAVHPDYQGQGVGYALVRDLLQQFERRGVRIITVNTQKDNQASLALYQMLGFRLTGEEYPIYQYAV